MERWLELSAERTEASLSAAGVGTWSWSPADRTFSLGPVATRLLGRSTSTFDAAEGLESVHPADRDRVAATFREAVRTQEPIWGEYRFILPSGEVAWMQVRSAPLGGGAVGGVLVDTTAVHEGSELVGLRGGLRDYRWLSSLSRVLSTALTSHDVAVALHEHAKMALGATFAGLLVLDDETETLSFLYDDPLHNSIRSQWNCYPLSRNSPGAAVVRDRSAKVYTSQESLLDEYPDLATDTQTSDMHAWAGFPMVVSGRPVGALILWWNGDRKLDSDELLDIGSAAAQCAQAVERSRLYERQQDVAQTLQQAVLPRALPTVEGLDVSARFLPAEKGLEVGGDWYDTFVLPDGDVFVTFGDVTGHGVKAAAGMGQLRNAMRAYAYEGYTPAETISRVDRLVTLAGEDLCASVVCVQYRPSDGTFTWCNAGHLPPLIETGCSVETLDEVHGPLIGSGLGITYAQSTKALEPGSTLVLYSDGLVEEREAGIAAGIATIQEVSGRPWHTTLDVHCSRVLDEVLQGRERDDDLCLLMLRRRHGNQFHAEASFPRDLETPKAAREFLTRTLDQWDVLHLEDTTTLLISEVVTNAVIHADSAPKVTLTLDDEALVVSVHDTSPLLPVRRRFRLETSNGRGVGLVDSLADAWGVDQTPGGKDVWFELGRNSEGEGAYAGMFDLEGLI